MNELLKSALLHNYLKLKDKQNSWSSVRLKTLNNCIQRISMTIVCNMINMLSCGTCSPNASARRILRCIIGLWYFQLHCDLNICNVSWDFYCFVANEGQLIFMECLGICWEGRGKGIYWIEETLRFIISMKIFSIFSQICLPLKM